MAPILRLPLILYLHLLHLLALPALLIVALLRARP
jgi:hypothetical protein